MWRLVFAFLQVPLGVTGVIFGFVFGVNNVSGVFLIPFLSKSGQSTMSGLSFCDGRSQIGKQLYSATRQVREGDGAAQGLVIIRSLDT